MGGFSGSGNGYAALAVQSEVRGEGIFFAVQGNILESDRVVTAAVDAFLADGGTFKLSGPDGRAVLQELVIGNAEGDSGWRVQARSGVDRPTGHIAFDLRQQLDGSELMITAEDAPLFLAAPWLPAGVLARDSQVNGTLTVSIANASRERRSASPPSRPLRAPAPRWTTMSSAKPEPMTVRPRMPCSTRMSSAPISPGAAASNSGT